MISSKYREFTGILLICYLILFFGYLFFFDYVHPAVIVGVGVFLTICSLFVIGVSIIELKRSWNYSKEAIAGIFLGAIVILSALIFSAESIYYLKYQALFDTLKSACNGKSYPENPNFREQGYNSLLAIDPPEKAGTWSVHPIMLGWVPENPNEVALIACFNEYDTIVETCNYSGVTVKRYQNKVTIELIEVKTGNTLEEQAFLGTEPNKCLAAVTEGGEIRGKAVEWSKIENWLDGFVNPQQ